MLIWCNWSLYVNTKIMFESIATWNGYGVGLA